MTRNPSNDERTARIKNRIAVFFRRWRAESPYSTRDIERLAGLAEGEYRAWEEGTRTPPLRALEKLGAIFGADFVLEINRLGSELQEEFVSANRTEDPT